MDATHNLLAICRAWLQQGRFVADQVEDWIELRNLAALHRVQPVVYRQLAAQSGDLPQGELAWWEQTARQVALFNLKSTSELFKVMGLLQKAGAQPVPIKGPCLSQEIYHDVSFREFGDLDLLVPKPQVLACLAALHQAGYVINDGSRHPPEPRRWPAYISGQRGEVPLFNRQSGTHIDLHWRMISLISGGKRDWRAMLNPSPLILAGRELPRLAPDHLLAYLAMHGFKHGWHRLAWLMDLAVLLKGWERPGPAQAPPSIRASAQNRVIYLSSLCLAESLLGVELPAGMAEDPRFAPHLPRARRLAEALAMGIHLDLGAPPSQASLLKLQLDSCPSPLSKAACIMRLAGAVGFEEARSLHLPGGLRFLYYPYRLYRLLARPQGDPASQDGSGKQP